MENLGVDKKTIVKWIFKYCVLGSRNRAALADFLLRLL